MALELETGLNVLEFLAWAILLGLLYFKYPGRRGESYWNILVGFVLITLVSATHLLEMVLLEEHAATMETLAHFLNMAAAILIVRGLLATQE